LQALIAGEIYVFVVMLAQGSVVLSLFALRTVCVHQSKRVAKAVQKPM
jgi:hypothetical protein